MEGGLLLWSYVDDVNLLTTSPERLAEVVTYLRELEQDFPLRMSAHKTSVLTNDETAMAQMEESTGLRASNESVALGGHWTLSKRARLTF